MRKLAGVVNHSSGDLATNASIENADQCRVIADHRINVGLNPFPFVNGPPADLIASVHDDMFEQNTLGAAVALPKGVNDIEIAKILCNSGHQSSTIKPLKPASLS